MLGIARRSQLVENLYGSHLEQHWVIEIDELQRLENFYGTIISNYSVDHDSDQKQNEKEHKDDIKIDNDNDTNKFLAKMVIVLFKLCLDNRYIPQDTHLYPKNYYFNEENAYKIVQFICTYWACNNIHEIKYDDTCMVNSKITRKIFETFNTKNFSE